MIFINEPLSCIRNCRFKVHYHVCITAPPNILSNGIWGDHKIGRSPLKSSFPIFLLQIVIIYAITRALTFPLKKLGLPILIPQMMVSSFINNSNFII